MRRPKPHIGNHPGVRSGVFYLLLLLGGFQGIKWGMAVTGSRRVSETRVYVDSAVQKRLDLIRIKNRESAGWTLRPFNPNYLDDFKGYMLGIPHGALDSLYAYRTRGGVLHSLAEFQRVSGLPDSVCVKWKPYFHFPPAPSRERALNTSGQSVQRDLNTASAAELQMVRGIGPVLSGRIVRFREALGGFLHPDQLLDVYGLPPEVALLVSSTFPLETIPKIPKMDINSASAAQLASLVYITPVMAAELVALRDSLGPYQNLEDLKAVGSLPADRIERIALYLQF